MYNLKMGLLERLKLARSKLQSVQTRVVLETGLEIKEERNENGEFTAILAKEVKEDSFDSPDDSGTSGVSNRRKKLVERCLRYGYVLDLKPDLQIANVDNGVYLSSQDVAQDFKLLKSTGITHIINIATGVKNFFPTHFEYLMLNALDLPSQNLRRYFQQAIEFITDAVNNNGKVLVHCNAGISRSSTIVLAYIMNTKRISLIEALDLVRKTRPIAKPNDGFMLQLKHFEKELNLTHSSVAKEQGNDVINANNIEHYELAPELSTLNEMANWSNNSQAKL